MKLEMLSQNFGFKPFDSLSKKKKKPFDSRHHLGKCQKKKEWMWVPHHCTNSWYLSSISLILDSLALKSEFKLPPSPLLKIRSLLQFWRHPSIWVLLVGILSTQNFEIPSLYSSSSFHSSLYLRSPSNIPNRGVPFRFDQDVCCEERRATGDCAFR